MMVLFTSLGFLSAICFGLCTLPQILRVRKRKSTADISLLFILMSLVGNLSAASYIVYSNIQAHFYQWPQYLNYSLATTLGIILLSLKIKYDRDILIQQFRRTLGKTKAKLYRQLFIHQQQLEERIALIVIFMAFIFSMIILFGFIDK